MAKPSILIVDDEKDNLEALRRLLRGDFEITITTSPFDALKLVQQNEYYVIVSDQRMPEMTGVELLEKVKNVCPSTTRILLTGYTDIDSVIGAINRGNIYRYIAKPWDPAELKITLKQAAEAFHLKRELERKNEALVLSNQQLQSALEDLRILDRAKARFLSLVSHELNTPLTIIVSFSSFLSEQNPALSPELTKAVNSIGRASERLSDIVTEVLTFVKLESDAVWVKEELDLHAETLRLKGKLEADFARKKILLVVESDPNVVLKCDPEKMKLAIFKLLQDAFVRSPDQKKIQVEIRTKGKSIRYAITREGESLSEKAFKPLETASEELHHQQNLGLSLAIAKSIIEKHRCEILLPDSSAEGKGVTLIAMLHQP